MGADDSTFEAIAARTLVRTHRYRLKPNRSQHLALEAILEAQRLLYNAALQERIDAWRKVKKGITCFDQMKSLTQIRSDDPEGYGALAVTLCRATLRRLDEAFKGFLRRVKAGQTPGFPRFKPMSRWDSFGFNEFAGIRFDGKRLRFKGMPGSLRVHLHRDLPADAQLLSCQLRRDAKGWSVSLQVKYAVGLSLHTGPAVGMDVGIEKLAALSDGTMLASAPLTARYARGLRKAQRALARSQKGSVSRAKRRSKLARLQMKLANTRETLLHRHSSTLTKTYSVIVMEKLSIRDMSASAKGTIGKPGSKVKQKSGLNRMILDAGWGKFQSQIRYKAECAASRVIEVASQGTSQRCSQCGNLVAKTLAERMHRCPSCGLVLDRDLNAAINILQRGQHQHPEAFVSGRVVVGPGRGNVGAVGPCVPAENSVKDSN